MGDRANIVLHEGRGGQLYFYTHWQGRDLPVILQRALARRQRWNDEAYLARIIFGEMTAQEPLGSLNFGISTRLGDNEYPLLVVDVQHQRIGLVSAATSAAEPQDWDRSWSFVEYVSLNLAGDAWQALCTGDIQAGTRSGPSTVQDVATDVPWDLLDHLYLQTVPQNRTWRRSRRRRG
jgi:hypothetical protein